MMIIRIHHPVIYKSNDWKPGDQPTVKTALAATLIAEGKATFIREGCGCLTT
jgi:hypothetical protein